MLEELFHMLGNYFACVSLSWAVLPVKAFVKGVEQPGEKRLTGLATVRQA